MVGILLALQVNNWNEERKNTGKENDLMEVLVQRTGKNSQVFDQEDEDLTVAID